METSTTMDISKLWRQSGPAQPSKDNEPQIREPTKVRPQSCNSLTKPKRKRIGSAKATRFSWTLLVKHDQPVAPALQDRVRALTNQSTVPSADEVARPALVLPTTRVSAMPETDALLDTSPSTEDGDDAMMPLKPRRKATVFASRPVTAPLSSDLTTDDFDGPFEPVMDHDTRRKLTAWLRQFPVEQNDFLSPINYFELKYSQARGLTSAWRDPQKVRLAVAFGSLHGLAATNTPIPSLFLLQLVEEMGHGLFENYSSVRDEVAALVNPCLYYFESAPAYFERYAAKCQAVAEMKAQLHKVMEEVDSIKQSSMSSQVLSKLRTSVAFVKHNKVSPNVHKRHNSIRGTPPNDEDMVNELQIKEFLDYMAPDDIAHMLLRVLDEKTMTTTLAAMVDAMSEDQRMEFYAAYQKCMSADELYLFISRQMSEKNFMTRQASSARLSRSRSVHATEGFVNKLRRLLCIDHIPPPPQKDMVFTPEEEHVLVTVAALMESCQEIRNELTSCTLKDVIPIHSTIRNTMEKLLQYGAPPVDPNALVTVDEDCHDQANNNDDCKPSPQDAENDDDIDDEEDDEFDVSDRQKKKGVRRKTRRRKGAVSGKTKASRVMPLADVCSAISSLLCEKLWQEANDRSKLTLRPFMRQYFIRVYGLKSLALAHIASFKHSLGANQRENTRASLFYWFLGCDESRKFSADYAFEFFKTVVKHVLVVHNKAPVKPFLAPATPDVMNSLESIQYAWNDLLGDGCVVDDSESNSSTKRRMVTLAKATEVTKLSFYDGNDREATVSVFLDELKEKASPLGMEDFLSGIMDCWLKCFESTVQLIRVKFREADKNGDGAMDFEEFVTFMQASNVLGFSEDNAPSRRATASIFRKPATSAGAASSTAPSSPSKRTSNAIDAESKQREAARTEARMRREAIAIYDSLTNDDNIIDENAFIEYLLTQVQWLSNEEDSMSVSEGGASTTSQSPASTSSAPSPGDKTPVNDLVLDGASSPVQDNSVAQSPIELNPAPTVEGDPPATTSLVAGVAGERPPELPSTTLAVEGPGGSEPAA